MRANDVAVGEATLGFSSHRRRKRAKAERERRSRVRCHARRRSLSSVDQGENVAGGRSRSGHSGQPRRRVIAIDDDERVNDSSTRARARMSVQLITERAEL